MKVYCVCIEESDDEGDVFRVEIFSTIENATIYLNKVTDGGTLEDVVADIVEYEIDTPESGDTTYAVDDSDFSTNDEEDYSSSID